MVELEVGFCIADIVTRFIWIYCICRYGDLTPKTVFGKLHAMTWMLIGLALTSMVTGNLSSIFSMEFVFEPSSHMTSKDRVGSNFALHCS